MPLTLLHQDQRSNHRDGVDIIAVHDINGDPLKTWTDPRTNVLWLRDLLPQYVPKARVLTYAYNAQSVLPSVGPADGILAQAQTMIGEICANRSLANCPRRPIIFICHGVGGLLVKRALIFSASQNYPPQDHLHSVFNSTFGILFFGTPHRGADKKYFHKLNSPRSRIFRSQKENSLLSVLDRDSETLALTNAEFSSLSQRLYMYYFFEANYTRFTSGLRQVVTQESAAPYGYDVERCSIPTDHLGMVQFASDKMQSFHIVSEVLTRYCGLAPHGTADNWRRADLAMAQTKAQNAKTKPKAKRSWF